MKLISHTKTGFKLLLFTLALAACTVVITAYSHVGMKTITAFSNAVYNRNLLGMIALDHFNINILRSSRAEKNIIACRDASRLSALHQSYAEQRGKTLEAFRALAPFFQDAADRADLDALQAGFSKWLGLHDKIAALASANDAAQTAAAVALSTGEGRAASDALENALSAIVRARSAEAERQNATINATAGDIDRTAIVICIICVVFGLTLGSLIIRRLMGQLGDEPASLAAIAELVASGNLDKVRFDANRPDVGVFGAMKTMVANLAGKGRELEEKVREAARHAQLADAATKKADAAEERAERARAEGMLAAANKLEAVVERLTSASEELSAQVEQSSRGAEEQAKRVTETATAMEEMSSTVLEVAKNAGTAAKTTDDARTKATEGANVTDEAVKSIGEVERQAQALKADMATLGKQADGIGQIMNVISDIADQTNLLALNAAIEAARAGEAGRGFAVVADEVRKLAEKTMAATREVGESISGIQSGTAKNIAEFDTAAKAVDAATELSQKSGAALREIVGMVESASDQVRSIATASEEQSAASEEINHSIGEINTISTETSQAMGQAAQAVSELANQSQVLKGIIEKMQGDGRGTKTAGAVAAAA